jgi:hypothetical protein
MLYLLLLVLAIVCAVTAHQELLISVDVHLADVTLDDFKVLVIDYISIQQG